ncbi:MAG: NifU family protein [Bacteroidia bacterium]|nr:NifU family protein [Bacteroidia bacterium]
MTIYTEVTPNPASLKFVVETILLPTGTAEFTTPAAAEGKSVLAEKLFVYPFVTNVFIGRNFVTVTKTDSARWEDVIPVVKDEIKRVLAEHSVVVAGSDYVAPSAEGDAIVQRIQQIIEEQVRPAVAMDGGDIVYEGFDEGTVKLRLRGSCSGCPSSMLTLKAGIEGLLTRMVPEVKAVEAI